MRFGPTARRIACALAGCLTVSLAGSTLVANASPTVDAGVTSEAADRGVQSSAASGGMYGELAGNPSRTIPQMRVGRTAQAQQASAADGGTTSQYDKDGTVCGVFANSAGMGSYCSQGGGVGQPRSLAEKFPGLKFDNCRYEDPPPGVDVPRNTSPNEKKWQLRTCLTAINWLTPDGGPDRRVIMDLVLIDKDTDTTYHDTPLSDYLWNNRQTTYPIPMLQVEPKTYPVVGQEAYFTFDWLDAKDRTPVQQGPYAGAPGGGPYVEHEHPGSDMRMRARATEMRIDPQIEGEKPFTCTIDDLGYDQDKSPRPKDQRSDCYYIFKRSSAAAREISTAEAHLQGDKDVFRMKIEVRWEVEFGRSGEMSPLGDGYSMVLFQDLPVRDNEAINVPPPMGEIG